MTGRRRGMFHFNDCGRKYQQMGEKAKKTRGGGRVLS